ncbi:hypothetical protein ACH4PU_30740 [Streptomyces sp. NPDC021100]|uniref:hypothetical protein n=1 Tax=Streptomyces sp. NPDC021100 TaxID=3365114 RepID=UPI00378BF4BE
MRHNRFSKRAEARRRYTGESYEQARRGLEPGRAAIPEPASAHQRLLEAYVLGAALHSRYDFTEFALGIRRVRPHAGWVSLEVESEGRAKELLPMLLPVYEPDGDVHGLLGLRIHRRTERGIELREVGRQTSVWLTGLPPSAWDRAERSLLERTRESGWIPLWKGPARRSPEEAAFAQQWRTGRYAQNFEAGAWLGSGLLRRLPLFHNVVAADLVTGHKGAPSIRGYEGLGPVRWCIDIDHRTGVPHRKEELVAALTDTELGLPVRRAHHLDQLYPRTAHWVRLDDEAATGLIELRFTTMDYKFDDPRYDGRYRDLHAGIRRRVAAVLSRT